MVWVIVVDVVTDHLDGWIKNIIVEAGCAG